MANYDETLATETLATEETATPMDVVICKPSDVDTQEEPNTKKKKFLGIGLKTVTEGATLFGAGYFWHKYVSPKFAEYNAYRKEQRRLKKEARKAEKEARKAEKENPETED